MSWIDNLKNIKFDLTLKNKSKEKTKKSKKKKANLKELFNYKKWLQKYDYDINKVIGVKDSSKYILYTDKKLIRIYRGKLKSNSLISSYIPIEEAIFYNFTVEKNVMDKLVDRDSFIETKVYEEAGLQETEEYIIKYKIIDKLQKEGQVLVQCVIVAKSFIEKSYEDLIKKVGYIDYLSFPAFAYKSLYEEKILKKGNDLFIVILYDKIFLTFYSEGELVSINTISGGLNIVYDGLESLKISNFDKDLFYKLLSKKGLDENRYLVQEKVVLNRIKNEFENRLLLIKDEITRLLEEFEISRIDRVFVTSEYGRIPGLNEFFKEHLNLDILDFEFYEEYNLDRLPVDPFLFLGMLETHYAYKSGNLDFNYSLKVRPPTFFYRPSGQLVAVSIVSIILLSLYPIYLYIDGFIYSKKAQKVQIELNSVKMKKNKYDAIVKKLKSKLKQTSKEIVNYQAKIKDEQHFIETLYKFKFSYIPKSQELVDLTLLMNKYLIYLDNLNYENGTFVLRVYSRDSKKLGKFIDSLIQNGFAAVFDKITKENNKYYTDIRIVE